MTRTAWIVGADQPRLLAARLERRYGARLRRLARAVLKAAAGDAPAAAGYVDDWAALTDDLLRLVQAAQPDVVFRSSDGATVVVQAKGQPIRLPAERLLVTAPVAPVSGWVASEGLERGLGLSLLAAVREVIPGAAPLAPPPGRYAAWTTPDRIRMALALIGHAVVERMTEARASAGTDALNRVMEIFGLDRTETARLFGITRQALDHWRRQGVPTERQAKLTAILAIGELLERNLRPGVVPGVARTPAKAYNNRTMLDRIAANEQMAVLDQVRQTFDWATPA